ncbi:MAG TPA: serine/threonine-protein kinase, partial [Gemmatimonadales bacterium]|nr:serine/threonine-protein kinase [Gemmatimonadales bacterium]
EGIPNAAPGCPRCGVSFGDDTNRPEPVSDELEQALRRELGGQYQITDLLGRGGMSLVYLAQEVELNRQVAIKVLPLQLVHGPSAAERFEREAKIAASLDHPHIVPIFRVGATSTFLWYTMKRIRGLSLEQVIADRGALGVAEVLGIIEQVGSALQYAHRHGVVHRDIKPANVLIEESGWALVCDFGVARAFGSVSLTQTGSSLGTPRYMSPEQFEGQPVDGRSDQYSLAILAWEALTGGVPFTGDSLGELIRKHLLEPPPLLADVKPEVTQRVSDAIHRAMGKKPAERFPDIAAFVEALGGKAAPRIPVGFSGPTPTAQRGRLILDSPTELVVQRRRRPATVMIATVAVGLALAAVGVWVGLRPGRSANGATPEQRTLVDSTLLGAGDTQQVAVRQPANTLAARRTAPRPPPTSPQHRPAQSNEGNVPAPAVLAPAKLSISTQPVWGQVLLDGRLVRNTPVVDLEIAPGPHRVQVKQDGFVTFDTTFNAAPGQVIRWTRITLRPIGG